MRNFIISFLLLAAPVFANKDVSISAGSTSIVSVAGPRPFISVQNKSDAPLFMKWDGSTNNLVATNGYRLGSGDTIILANDGTKPIFTHSVVVLNTNASAKVVNVQGED